MSWEGAVGQSVLEGGVSFQSYEMIKDQRTGIDLTPDEPFRKVSSIEIQFDIKFWRDNRDFGHILRLLGSKGVNIDLVSLPPVVGAENLLVVIGETSTKLSVSWDEEIRNRLDWMTLSLLIDNDARTVSLKIKSASGGTALVKSDSLPVIQEDYHVVFGKNDMAGIRTSDVPPIVVKDVRVTVNNTLRCYWPLLKHNEGISYDELNMQPLMVTNGKWVITRHVSWSAIDSVRMPLRPQIAYNGIDELYLLTADHFIRYNFQNNTLARTELSTSTALPMAQQSIYYPATNEIWTYDYDQLLINKFDIEQLRWVEAPADFHKEPRHWHINRNMTSAGASYFFGGYGFHRYKNFLFTHEDSVWRTQPLEAIEPRYLSASGLNSKGELVVFGGYGNTSGLQEQGTHAYHDCHIIDPSNSEVTELWEAATPMSDYVHSSSLIVDEQDSSFLVLSFPNDQYYTHVFLEQYDLKTGEKTVFDDSLQFRFDDTSSYADLLLDSMNNRVIALLTERDERGYVVYLHGLNIPALKQQAILQPMVAATTNSWWPVVLVLLLLAIGAMAAVVIVRNRKSKNAIQALLDANYGQEHQKSAILIMGGFQVFDKEGNNVTKKFSATLKLLFCLILLYSQNGRKGASSQMLWEEVWGDKPENKARNNRNVNINKLREILSEVGNIQIVGEANRWKIVIGEDVFCDYQYVCSILNQRDEETAPLDIIPLAEKGNILPGMEIEWLDQFKSDFSNRLVDRLLALDQRHKLPSNAKIQLANAVFKFDMIDREALFIKCRALMDAGKYALAKESYEHFAKEFEHMYNEPFDIKFEQIIHPETV